MKIAVIAANGRTGSAFVNAALAAGHNVQAGVYNQPLNLQSPQLTVVQCDATNLQDVTTLLTGQDAVVCLIGHVKGSPAKVQTTAITNVVQAMQNLGIKRVVSLTGTGVRLQNDKITLVDRVLNAAVKFIDPKRVMDGLEHFTVLRNSSLDWTVIRVLKLQNTSPKPYKLKLNGPTKVVVSRVEVAQALLEVLEQNTFIKQAPIIGKL